MPVTEAAKDVLRKAVANKNPNAIDKMLSKKWMVVKVGEWLNKEDKVVGLIFRKTPNDTYEYFGYVGWGGQLGYTLHAGRLNGIPMDDLKEIMEQSEELL